MRLYVLVLLAACGSDGGNAAVDAAGSNGSGSNHGSGSNGSGSGIIGSGGPLDECVSQTNMYRQMNGKPALTESSQLEAYAATGAMDDYTSGSAHSHFMDTQGGGIAFAENECPGFDGWNLGLTGGDMTALVDMCMQAFYSEGPGGGHYENMMGAFGTLGCGIYEDTATQNVTITQDYGM